MINIKINCYYYISYQTWLEVDNGPNLMNKGTEKRLVSLKIVQIIFKRENIIKSHALKTNYFSLYQIAKYLLSFQSL